MWEPGKPSQNENEYFARQDAEWVKTQRVRLDAERGAKDSVRSAVMTCPRCQGELREQLHHDVRIDVCTTCRGVWLDKGELHMLAHVDERALLRVVSEIDGGSA